MRRRFELRPIASRRLRAALLLVYALGLIALFLKWKNGEIVKTTDDPNGTLCRWSEQQNDWVNLKTDALGRDQLCQPAPPGKDLWELPTYSPLLPPYYER